MPLQIRSEVKQLSPVERELSVVVPGTEVAKQLDKAYRSLGEKVRIKGFRPGKVPRQVLEQYYKGTTEAQVVETIVGESYREALKAHDLTPVANPNIPTVPELISGMDFAYQARVEVKPVFELKDWKGLALEKNVYEIDDTRVNAELVGLRERYAKIVPVENREDIHQGDLVETNWSGTVDGEHVKGLSGVSFAIEVGAGNFFPKPEQALVGKKVGDSFTVDVVIPESHRIESARGKTATLTIRPLGLKLRQLPNLDDEFARDLGEEFQTLDSVKAKIRENLEATAKDRTDAELREQALEKLIEANAFDVPASMVTRHAQQLAADRLSSLPQARAEQLWQAQSQRMTEDARPLALRQVRVSLVLEQLVKNEGIEVTDADLDAHFERVAPAARMTAKQLKQMSKKGGRLEDVRLQVASAKMLERLLEGAKITEKKQPLP